MRLFLVAAALSLASVAQADIAAGEMAALKVPTVEGAPQKGPRTAKVTIIYYSDFQCPFCGRVEPTLAQLLAKYGNELRLVWKNNPLPFHPRARPTALAAMAAHEQGKFWALHDKFFAAQQSLADDDIEQSATEIGVDMAKWRAAKAGPRVAARVDADVKEATALAVRGTPMFFVNSRRVNGAQPIDKFIEVIDAELRRAEALLAGGVSRGQLYATLMKDGVEAEPPAPPSPPPSRPVDDSRIFHVTLGAAPVRGAGGAKVTIVEWADFQCPFSARVEATLDALRAQYGSELRIVSKQMPLPFHSEAHLAAEAALAARAQGGDGKYWEMHRALYAKERALTRKDLDDCAADIGLDMARFASALDNRSFRQAVDADVTEGNTIGARGTPTFFINGKILVGAQSIDVFKAVIDAQLRRADKLLAAGVSRARLYDELVKDGQTTFTDTTVPAEPDKVYQIDVNAGPALGPRDARVQIVMFTDFECPFCARFLETFKALEAKYRGRVRFVFRNHPLPFHPHAKLAAEAALAAHEQGKFWEMHELLFTNNQHLERVDLVGYAQRLGLDLARFTVALDSGKFTAAVAADAAIATRLAPGMGTPTFFINGKKLVGALPLEAFTAAIDAALAR